MLLKSLFYVLVLLFHLDDFFPQGSFKIILSEFTGLAVKSLLQARLEIKQHCFILPCYPLSNAWKSSSCFLLKHSAQHSAASACLIMFTRCVNVQERILYSAYGIQLCLSASVQIAVFFESQDLRRVTLFNSMICIPPRKR